MPEQLSSLRIRSVVSVDERDRWIDVATEDTPKLIPGNAIRFDFLLQENAAIVDGGNIASSILTIKDLATGGGAPSPADPALMQQTITSITANPSQADWDAGTAQHLTFFFAEGATNLGKGKYWMALEVYLTTGEPITVQYGKIEFEEDGVGLATTVDPITNYITLAVANSTFAQQASLRASALFAWFGDLAVADVVGSWTAPVAESILAVQLSAQKPPVGADLTFDVYKDGVTTGESVTLAAGSSHAQTVLSSGVSLAIGEVITLVCTQVGSTTSGGFLTVNLIRQPVNS
ncbi:MAG: hypothetical protein AAGJ81_08110 [Verrucomicrobiota bacterium]